MIQAQGYKLQTLAIEANVTNAASVKRMVSETVKKFGSLDYGLSS
jgi:hypothetical protein